MRLKTLKAPTCQEQASIQLEAASARSKVKQAEHLLASRDSHSWALASVGTHLVVPLSLWRDGRGAAADAYAAMVTMIFLKGGEGEPPCRKQRAAWVLVAVVTASC